MLIEPMIQQLNQLRLHGMAAGLEQLLRPGRPPNFPHRWPFENPPPLK